MCYNIVMKDKIIIFLKSKFNITLIILQALAVASYLLSSAVGFLSILFFLLESAFFVAWGIGTLIKGKNKYSQETFNQLPYSEEEKENFRKLNESNKKNSKFMGSMLILLGLIILFSLFSYIF